MTSFLRFRDNGKKLGKRPHSKSKRHISYLTRDHTGIPHEELENVTIGRHTAELACLACCNCNLETETVTEVLEETFRVYKSSELISGELLMSHFMVI